MILQRLKSPLCKADAPRTECKVRLRGLIGQHLNDLGYCNTPNFLPKLEVLIHHPPFTIHQFLIHQLCQSSQQLLLLERFGEVAAGTEVHGDLAMLVAAAGGEHQDGDVFEWG